MYINVYSSPNFNIQYNSCSSAHKLFQGNYRITGRSPTQRAIRIHKSFFYFLSTDKTQATIKWLDSSTGSERNLNWQPTTTPLLLRGLFSYSAQFGFVWPHPFVFLLTHSVLRSNLATYKPLIKSIHVSDIICLYRFRRNKFKYFEEYFLRIYTA